MSLAPPGSVHPYFSPETGPYEPSHRTSVPLEAAVQT